MNEQTNYDYSREYSLNARKLTLHLFFSMVIFLGTKVNYVNFHFYTKE